MGYRDLVEPIWDQISIYDGPDVFLEQFAACPHVPRTLFAAHWCQSEVCNGGFDQFFFNSTGVLAPEAAEAFDKIGMPRTAAVIRRAMARLRPDYPRERAERQDALDACGAATESEDGDAFGDLDDAFFVLIETENGGFEAAADAYAAE